MKTNTRDFGAIGMGAGFGALIRSAIGVADPTVDILFIIVVALGAWVFMTQKTKAAKDASESKAPGKL
jgi:hypothetical protein